jgi:hypothetical protein
VVIPYPGLIRSPANVCDAVDSRDSGGAEVELARGYVTRR